tara:strand:+ start:20 stop:553 length:534 start_codon:yes stop_codon:yes gene_type:complete
MQTPVKKNINSLNTRNIKSKSSSGMFLMLLLLVIIILIVVVVILATKEEKVEPAPPPPPPGPEYEWIEVLSPELQGRVCKNNPARTSPWTRKPYKDIRDTEDLTLEQCQEGAAVWNYDLISYDFTPESQNCVMCTTEHIRGTEPGQSAEYLYMTVPWISDDGGSAQLPSKMYKRVQK